MNTDVNYCKVCFEDNGIGIHNAYTEKIFDFFTRLDPTTQIHGFGMGLSQSRKIIRNHNGAILVQSTPGKGSNFSLLFPVTRS